MTGLEVCGHVDVKVPSKGRKFGHWKAWRRQWCVVRRGKAGSVQLIVGSNHNSPTSCIDIPFNAVICRSESRSREFALGVFCPGRESRLRQPVVFLAGHSETEAQQWMLRIRNLLSPPTVPVEKGEFSVSLVDNAHSRKAGLTGLYGTLRGSAVGLRVSDPATGQPRASWDWGQLSSAALDTTAETEKAHIVTLYTSSEFPCGEGEVRLFCQEGELLEGMLSRHLTRPLHRLTCSPLPPLPRPSLLASRRLSRSEGDLRCWPQHGSLESLFHLRTQSVSQHDKVASGLITAGLGLLLTTPGCSEPDSLHDYQCLDSHWPSHDSLADLPDIRRQRYADSGRRESGVSVASGIYEEIDEGSAQTYEPASGIDPPPLPPRKTELSGSQANLTESEEPLIYSVVDEEQGEKREEEEEEPLYLPMSAGGKHEAAYVTMANLVNQGSHLSETVT